MQLELWGPKSATVNILESAATTIDLGCKFVENCLTWSQYTLNPSVTASSWLQTDCCSIKSLQQLDQGVGIALHALAQRPKPVEFIIFQARLGSGRGDQVLCQLLVSNQQFGCVGP